MERLPKDCSDAIFPEFLIIANRSSTRGMYLVLEGAIELEFPEAVAARELLDAFLKGRSDGKETV